MWGRDNRQACGACAMIPIIIARFCLGGRDVADGLEQPSVIEPVYPFEGGGGLGPEPAKQVGEASAGGELDGFERAPRPSPPDDLGLIPTAGYRDTFTQLRVAMDFILSGSAMRKFHASQQASMMDS